jgi:hypothetical protein
MISISQLRRAKAEDDRILQDLQKRKEQLDKEYHDADLNYQVDVTDYTPKDRLGELKLKRLNDVRSKKFSQLSQVEKEIDEQYRKDHSRLKKYIEERSRVISRMGKAERPMITVDLKFLRECHQFPTFQQSTVRHITPTTNDIVIFLSHRWVGDKVDDDRHTIYRLAMTALSQEPDSTLVWMDYFSVPNLESWEEKSKWINTIPFYLSRSQRVCKVTLDDTLYRASAWCFMEGLWDQDEDVVHTPSGPKPFDLSTRRVSTTDLHDLPSVLKLIGVQMELRGVRIDAIREYIDMCLRSNGCTDDSASAYSSCLPPVREARRRYPV